MRAWGYGSVCSGQSSEAGAWGGERTGDGAAEIGSLELRNRG